jgi:hypothetical protein
MKAESMTKRKYAWWAGFTRLKPDGETLSVNGTQSLQTIPELANCGFHAKKFFRRENEKRVEVYKGWPDEEADKLLERLSQSNHA